MLLSIVRKSDEKMPVTKRTTSTIAERFEKELVL